MSTLNNTALLSDILAEAHQHGTSRLELENAWDVYDDAGFIARRQAAHNFGQANCLLCSPVDLGNGDWANPLPLNLHLNATYHEHGGQQPSLAKPEMSPRWKSKRNQ